MNGRIYKDIHFNDSEHDDFFVVEEKIVFNFFLYRIIKSKEGEPFSIKNTYGPYYDYCDDNLDLYDVISVTFVCHKSDERPFVLILEKFNKTKNYYGFLFDTDNIWKPIAELNGIPEHIQQKLLLDVLKRVFSNFFESDLLLHESTIKNKIRSEVNIGAKYKRYYIKPSQTISVSNIYISGDRMEIKKNLKFVEKLYFYYANGYESNSLMMETVDYQIEGSLPYINYFIPESVGNKWVPVECGTDLLEPKCKSDIKRILDGVVEMYRNHPVTIDITKPNYDCNHEITYRLSGILFSNVLKNGEYYISNTFKSKATKSFFIENIMFDNVMQEIDIQSTEFESITVYYKVEQPQRPLLICLKIHNKTNTSLENFKWFYIPRFDKNVWLKLDFEAHPHNDKMLIEQKIKSMYGSISIINYIMIPLKWFTVFAIILTIGIMFLLRHRRRLRVIFFRLYHHIRT